jgi:hypothetical protein
MFVTLGPGVDDIQNVIDEILYCNKLEHLPLLVTLVLFCRQGYEPTLRVDSHNGLEPGWIQLCLLQMLD